MLYISSTESYNKEKIESIVIDKLDRLDKDSNIIKLIDDIKILL